LVREVRETDFAHPAEADLSRLLTFYRIRWSYEPTTFPLAFTSDGRPAEMFTPDFYLPDHRLYIELTTMRQRLVTRKNRKIRQLRERYPNVRVKLLYRRDYDRLVEAYRLGDLTCERVEVGPPLFDAGMLQERIRELASALACDLGCSPLALASLGSGDEHAVLRAYPLFADDRGQSLPYQKMLRTPHRFHTHEMVARPLLIAVQPGSPAFMNALTAQVKSLGVDVDTDRIILTRFTTHGGQRRVRVRRAPRTPVAGRRIVLIADVISTGLSLAYLIRWLKQRGAEHIDLCVLLDRRQARLVDVPVRYVGFEAPDHLLVGFGLQLRRQFEDLPFIAMLSRVPDTQPESH
jgi:hypoxanthine phosphoribosyltransferase